MPVLEHAFAAIFNYFVAVPIYPTALKEPKAATSSNFEKAPKQARSLPRVRRNNSAGSTNTNNISIGKRSRMDGIKRRTRVFSLSLPNPPPLMAGPPTGTGGSAANLVQTSHVADSSSHPQRDAQLGPRQLSPPSASTAPAPESTSGKKQATKEEVAGNVNENGWTGWPQDVDIIGTTSTENLTKLIATGPHNNNAPSGQKKKGIKRKRSNSSVASISSFSPLLSKKLSGLMARTPKKAKIAGNALPIQHGGNGVHVVQAREEVVVGNARVDLHAALRQGGCRLVGSSIDPDDIYADKPDDALLSISSILRTLTGEAQQQHQIPFMKASRLAIESTTYCLWVACYKALALFPYTDDKEEEAVKEERECYAMQLFMAEIGVSILERLPCEGVLHVPVDPRVSNNVVDTIHHTLYLVEAFGEAGAELHRLVFDIPATTAGIHAGHILSLTHNLHINYTLVCDLVQTAACLDARPYGVSVPTRLMKNVGDERVRFGNAARSIGGMKGVISTITNAGAGVLAGQQTLYTGLGYKPRPPGIGGATTAASGAATSSEQDIRDHPAFETIRAMVRLVELRAPEVLVSARDVDYRRFLHGLAGVHAVSLTQECLAPLRWHAYMTESQGASSLLYFAPTEMQRRRAEERARSVPHVVGINARTGRDEAAWEVELRREVEHNSARNPKIQRRYVDRDWISGSGLSKAVRDLAFGSTTTTAVMQPPEGFLSSLGGASKRSVVMVMEGALEEECKFMGRLHSLVADYLEKKFASLQGGGDIGGRARSRRSSRESTAEA